MKTVLITGGSSGIGKATVAGLAARDYKVVFVARNHEKADSVKKEIIDSSGNKHIDYILADLTSIKQVKDSARVFKENHGKLDVLINNAGVILPDRRVTCDGMEESFVINHLSHFILSNLLIELLNKSDDPRIINVSSAAHSSGRFDPQNLQSEKKFSSFSTYCNTKLLNILFTFELAERLKSTKITVNALHPGVVNSNFGNEFRGVLNFFNKAAKIFMISPEKGAVTSIWLASSEEVRNVTGKYFVRCKPVETGNSFITSENRKILWEKSFELSGL